MNAKLAVCALGLFVLTGTAAARRLNRSWFEARTAGVTVLTLRGSAEYGMVHAEAGEPGAFVLTLGAESAAGTVLITSRNGAPARPGTYALGEEPSGAMQALVVTGSPTRPTGAYRARSGAVTITQVSPDAIVGRFEIDAVGFAAAEPGIENRELVVRGTFRAAGQ